MRAFAFGTHMSICVIQDMFQPHAGVSNVRFSATDHRKGPNITGEKRGSKKKKNKETGRLSHKSQSGRRAFIIFFYHYDGSAKRFLKEMKSFWVDRGRACFEDGQGLGPGRHDRASQPASQPASRPRGENILENSRVPSPFVN